MSHPSTPEQATLAQALQHSLQWKSAEGVRLRDLNQGVGQKSFGLTLLLLALPSALPVPAPGYSTPFGIALLLISLQMILGRQSVWLPASMARIRIPPKLAAKLAEAAQSFLLRSERWVRPRQVWVQTRAARAGLALIVAAMALLMTLPIPLTNTAPAMVIFLIGMALAESDGLLALFAGILGLGACGLYTIIVYLVWTQGPEVIERALASLKALLGLGLIL
jgi:hypothetical protein